MPNPYFKFKRFTVFHDRCAMKVGTDGVLLGSWAGVEHGKRMLDIGTGTGLLALMMAQRNEQASIVGVEIDDKAAEQATENVKNSLWNDRIQIVCTSIQNFESEILFDIILSNPPYFSQSLKNSARNKTLARHTDSLNFEELLDSVCRLLTQSGEFSVVIPADSATDMILAAISRHLYVFRKTWVHSMPHIAAKRVLLSFCRQIPKDIEETSLIIESENHVYTDDYIELTKDFYLNI